MKIFGLTGGIGSGKSVVAELLGILGVPVYDSDTRSNVLCDTDKDLKEDLIRLRESYTTKMTTHNTNVDVAVSNTEVIGETLQKLPGGHDLSKDLAEVSMIIANLKLD